MVILGLLGALVISISTALAAGRIPPNRLIGLATPRTVKDERVWYPANRVAGRNGLLYGGAMVAGAIAASFGFLGSFTVLALITLLFPVFIIASLAGASKVVNQVDKSGPVIDYSRSGSTKKRSREDLMKKLRKE